ncbi:MAG: hypothetical protein WB711_23095 [Terriglobales bacterium]
MDRWIALGIFLLGAGAGSLASTLLHTGQICKLKRLLDAAAHNGSQKEEDHKLDGRKSA